MICKLRRPLLSVSSVRSFKTTTKGTTLKWRREPTDVDATSLFYIEVSTTSLWRFVHVGTKSSEYHGTKFHVLSF